MLKHKSSTEPGAAELVGAFRVSVSMEWLRYKWAWAKENPLFWANLALIGISILIFIWPAPVLATGPSDLRLRTWGLLLQLIGVVTVWLDLTSTARKFGKGSLLRRTWVWLKAAFGRNIIVSASGASFGISTANARVKIRRAIRPGAALPDRVTDLETNVQKIDDDLDDAYKEIGQRAAELDAKIKSEEKKHTAAIGEVRKSLEEAAAGNLATLLFGVVWLAIGIGIATLAPELVKLQAGEWRDVWKALW
jgi:hypothetical protein